MSVGACLNPNLLSGLFNKSLDCERKSTVPVVGISSSSHGHVSEEPSLIVHPSTSYCAMSVSTHQTDVVKEVNYGNPLKLEIGDLLLDGFGGERVLEFLENPSWTTDFVGSFSGDAFCLHDASREIVKTGKNHANDLVG